METRPIAVKWDIDKRVSTLIWSDGAIAPTDRYLMRGGISFPMLTETDGLQGFVVLIGLNLRTKKYYVFEEKEFKVVDHVIDDGKLIYEGISSWFPDMWKLYFADSYFYSQDFVTAKKYRTQVYRSPMANPNPAFIEVKWRDDDQAMHTVFEKDLLGDLRYMENGTLHNQMKMFTAGDKEVLPALHALKCALNGLDRYRIDHDVK